MYIVTFKQRGLLEKYSGINYYFKGLANIMVLVWAYWHCQIKIKNTKC